MTKDLDYVYTRTVGWGEYTTVGWGEYTTAGVKTPPLFFSRMDVTDDSVLLLQFALSRLDIFISSVNDLILRKNSITA